MKIRSCNYFHFRTNTFGKGINFRILQGLVMGQEDLEIKEQVDTIQTEALLKSARIRVVET